MSFFRDRRRMLLSLLTVAAMAVCVAGCSSTSELKTLRKDATTALHHKSTVKKVAKSSRSRKRKLISTGYCAYHGYRAVQDIRHQHPGWSAYQVYKTARSCKSAARRK